MSENDSENQDSDGARDGSQRTDNGNSNDIFY
jgi:hypothetical protein